MRPSKHLLSPTFISSLQYTIDYNQSTLTCHSNQPTTNPRRRCGLFARSRFLVSAEGSVLATSHSRPPGEDGGGDLFKQPSRRFEIPAYLRLPAKLAIAGEAPSIEID